MTTELSTLGTAIPYIGLALTAASLLYSSLGKGGTPHEGGIVFDTPTGVDTPNTIAGIKEDYTATSGDASPFLSPDWTDSFQQSVADALKPTVTTISSILNTTAETFGGKDGFTVGAAFSSDGEDSSRGRLGIMDSTGTELAQLVGNYDKEASTGIQ